MGRAVARVGSRGRAQALLLLPHLWLLWTAHDSRFAVPSLEANGRIPSGGAPDKRPRNRDQGATSSPSSFLSSLVAWPFTSRASLSQPPVTSNLSGHCLKRKQFLSPSVVPLNSGCKRSLPLSKGERRFVSVAKVRRPMMNRARSNLSCLQSVRYA